MFAKTNDNRTAFRSIALSNDTNDFEFMVLPGIYSTAGYCTKLVMNLLYFRVLYEARSIFDVSSRAIKMFTSTVGCSAAFGNFCLNNIVCKLTAMYNIVTSERSERNSY